ncbi:bifunctional acetaldehyde-CoA/alcohol dehydrogenase, partial [Salmonella enterica subsp. enterica serovar Newport str. SHSN008]
MTFAAAFCGGASLFPFEVSMSINSIEELNALVARVKKAQRQYASFTQQQVDKIFRAAALAAADARIPL